MTLGGPVLPAASAVACENVARVAAASGTDLPAGPGLASVGVALVPSRCVGDVSGNAFLAAPFALVLLARRFRRAIPLHRAAIQETARRREVIIAERLRLARDLHDVVGHGMGAITVQAGAARLAVAAGDATTATRSLLSIEDAGRGVLREVRWLVGLLREDNDRRGLRRHPRPRRRPPAAPACDVELEIAGDLTDSGTDTGEAGYRIVQEALTNVLRHSGQNEAHVRIEVGRQVDDRDSQPARRPPRPIRLRRQRTAGVYASAPPRWAGTSCSDPTQTAGPCGPSCRRRPRAMTIRVGIADDQPMIRDGFRLQVQFTDDLEFVGAAADGEQAVALARSERPDVLLMDVRMPLIDGIEATRMIVADPALSDVRVSCSPPSTWTSTSTARCGRARAGSCSKTPHPKTCIARSSRSPKGAPCSPRTSPAASSRSSPHDPHPPVDLAAPTGQLTTREVEVLRLVARGLSNGELAAELVLSPLTVKTHVSRILTKLGLRDRAQLVVLAYETGSSYPAARPEHAARSRHRYEPADVHPPPRRGIGLAAIDRICPRGRSSIRRSRTIAGENWVAAATVSISAGRLGSPRLMRGCRGDPNSEPRAHDVAPFRGARAGGR